MNQMSQPMQVLTSRSTVEWFTPPKYIELVREVLGGIDLDPASSLKAQEWIKADRFFTKETDGLIQFWRGRVFLNPPFDDTKKWVTKLVEQYDLGYTLKAIALINSNLGYRWYEELWRMYPVCLVKERIEFICSTGEKKGQAKRGQTFVYLGDNVEKFSEVFKKIGRIILPEGEINS